jgi:hypothetical protein
LVESKFLPDAGGGRIIGKVVVGFEAEGAGDRGFDFACEGLVAEKEKRVGFSVSVTYL